MRPFLFIIVLITQIFASSSVKELTIGKFNFLMIRKSYDIYDSKGKVMMLYREENNRDLTFVLRLILKDATGGCTSKGIQDGFYEIDERGITLYSMWDRRGKAYIEPYGARIQRYEIQSDASLKLVSSRVYIEMTRKKHDEDSGMKYLFEEPKNKSARLKLNTYVKEVERLYNGKFVFDKEAKKLLDEVKDALRRKVQVVWKRGL